MPEDAFLSNLLLRKHEAENTVKVLRERISASRTILQRLCDKLKIAPDKVVFTNAPDNLGDFASFPPEDCCFNWADVPDRIDLAQDIKALRDATDELKSLERQLR